MKNINKYKIGDKFKTKNSGGYFPTGYIYEIAGKRIADNEYLIFDVYNKETYFTDYEINEMFELVQDEKIEDFTIKVRKILNNIESILIEKNRKYGNSALEPVRIFSKMPKDEQLKVRIDDKLSRISNQQLDEDEDVVTDLIGYLVLLEIAKEKE